MAQASAALLFCMICIAVVHDCQQCSILAWSLAPIEYLRGAVIGYTVEWFFFKD